MLAFVALLAVATALQAPKCNTAQRLLQAHTQELPSVTKASCRFCGATFAGKNALFRHLRESDVCSAAASAEDPRATDAILILDEDHIQ